MSKIAFIDIGTNSVRMIILDENDADCIYAKKRVITTRIGEGVDKTKQLSVDGMNRTLEALVEFEKIAKEEDVKEILAIATSAVRDAKNKDAFLDIVKKNTKIKISVISGSEEARLGFLGVSKGVEKSGIVKSDEHILIIDIGGGSTEIIVGKGSNIEYSTSIDIGAVRLTDQCVDSDPVSLLDQDKIADKVRKEINEVISIIKEYPIKRVIGIGGTISTGGAIALSMEEYDRSRIHNYFVSLDIIYNINKNLFKLTIEDRKKTIGLQPERADIITTGFMILQLLLMATDSDGIVISEYDNLEGMFFDLYKK